MMNKTLFTLALMLLAACSLYAQKAVMNVIGDSYVANHRRSPNETWHYLLAKEQGFTYNNYGRNGSCVAFDRTHDGSYNFGPALWVRYSQMAPDADYVLIIAGHNDAVKVGENTDSLQMFADSLEAFLSGVEKHNPKAQIGYVTPWYVDQPGFQPVCRVIKKVCKQHGIPVLWNYAPNNVIRVRDKAFRKKYFQGDEDTAHLNAEGHKLFLPVAKAWFAKHMLKKKK